MTHCDKKPRGEVGGSAISVYQALLHLPTESLGTRLCHTVLLCDKNSLILVLSLLEVNFSESSASGTCR